MWRIEFVGCLCLVLLGCGEGKMLSDLSLAFVVVEDGRYGSDWGSQDYGQSVGGRLGDASVGKKVSRPLEELEKEARANLRPNTIVIVLLSDQVTDDDIARVKMALDNAGCQYVISDWRLHITHGGK